jgi:hypothetical protein
MPRKSSTAADLIKTLRRRDFDARRNGEELSVDALDLSYLLAMFQWWHLDPHPRHLWRLSAAMAEALWPVIARRRGRPKDARRQAELEAMLMEARRMEEAAMKSGRRKSARSVARELQKKSEFAHRNPDAIRKGIQRARVKKP